MFYQVFWRHTTLETIPKYDLMILQESALEWNIRRVVTMATIKEFEKRIVCPLKMP